MIFITGASRGLGKLLMDFFTEQGKSCRGTYFNSTPTDDKRLSRVDIRSYDEVFAWIESEIKKNTKEDIILINCAGITFNAFGHKADIDSWRKVIDVNLIGTFNAIRSVLPHMRDSNYGRIINFSSVVAQKGVPGTSAYAASKAGLSGMTKALSVENAGKNITINNINLGYFDIGIIEHVPNEQLDSVIRSIPVGRLGQPINIVKTIEFIIANNDICGTSLDINGGLF